MAPPIEPHLPPDGREDEEAMQGIPGFQGGGRVERTGIALVHEGEYIVPAPGSEAVIAPGALGGGEQVINYYFPIVIEIIGALSEEQIRRVSDHVFDALESELASRA